MYYRKHGSDRGTNYDLSIKSIYNAELPLI
ncbi:hypothetical protein FLWE109334_12540 [Flavobacterium weaverense]|uniref:Uncharacterized protein n=1 Tax=Flavobacterium weaverense TaxID=271156 RepID=A0A3L9ZKN3_9FLAO|nr:hypothetical protein BC961_2700 [Flavobacterium weaverense]